MSDCGRSWQARRIDGLAVHRRDRAHGLAPGRRRQDADIAEDANAAGRAARPTTTHAGMRDAVTQAGFEDAHALRHAHLPVGKRNRDQAAPALAQGAHAARHENEPDRCGIAEREVDKDDALDHPRLRGGHALQVLLAPLGVVGELGHFAPGMVRADHRQRRQQDGNGEKIRRRPVEERLHPQPEIETDAGVRPGNGERDELDGDVVRRADPIGEQRRGIIERRRIKQRGRQPLGAKMVGEPERNAQAEQKLGKLGAGIAKMPPLIERPQSEREMDDGRNIERIVDHRQPPEGNVVRQPRFHCVVGNDAERVVEEVRKDVGEHHQAGDETHLAHADPAQPCPDAGAVRCACRGKINVRRDLCRHDESPSNGRSVAER